MNTVVAAERVQRRRTTSPWRGSGSADRPDRATPTFFFYVPAGTPAFKVGRRPRRAGARRRAASAPVGPPVRQHRTRRRTARLGPPARRSAAARSPAPRRTRRRASGRSTGRRVAAPRRTAVSTFNDHGDDPGRRRSRPSLVDGRPGDGRDDLQRSRSRSRTTSARSPAAPSARPLGSAFADRPTIANHAEQDVRRSTFRPAAPRSRRGSATRRTPAPTSTCSCSGPNGHARGARRRTATRRRR